MTEVERAAAMDWLLERGAVSTDHAKLLLEILAFPAIVDELRKAEHWVPLTDEDEGCLHCGAYRPYTRVVHSRTCEGAARARIFVPGWKEAEIEFAHEQAIEEYDKHMDAALRRRALAGTYEPNPHEAESWGLERVERLRSDGQLERVWRQRRPWQTVNDSLRNIYNARAMENAVYRDNPLLDMIPRPDPQPYRNADPEPTGPALDLEAQLDAHMRATGVTITAPDSDQLDLFR